jgi:hypothetical protein
MPAFEFATSLHEGERDGVEILMSEVEREGDGAPLDSAFFRNVLAAGTHGS